MQDAVNTRDRIMVRTVGQRDNILQITLTRPEKANAYDQRMLEELSSQLSALRLGGRHRAIVLRASMDTAFCAGADMTELGQRTANDGFQLRSREVFDQLARLPICSVAMIDGAAVGGGFELALACDVRVCSDRASFRLPELTYGLSPAAGGLRRLRGLLGQARASQIALFGMTLDAHHAHAFGLVAYQGLHWQARGLELAQFAAEQDPIAWALNKAALCDDGELRSALEAATQALLYERRNQGGTA